MIELSKFFGVPIEYLRRDNSRITPIHSGGEWRPQQSQQLPSPSQRENRQQFEEEAPLRVEVERIPFGSGGLFFGSSWREVTITLERKY